MAKSPKPPMVDRELILELKKLLDETGLTEIDIEQEQPRRARSAQPHRSRSVNRPRPRSIRPSIQAW
jgi:hypothetical protein